MGCIRRIILLMSNSYWLLKRMILMLSCSLFRHFICSGIFWPFVWWQCVACKGGRGKGGGVIEAQYSREYWIFGQQPLINVVHVDTNNVVRVAVVAIIVLVTLIFAPRKKEHGKYLKNPKTSRTNEQTCQRKKIIKKKKDSKGCTVRLGSCLVQHFKKHAKERERPQNKLEKSYFLICFIEQVWKQ